MVQVSANAPLLSVSADARPSNYLVNHVSWSAPTDKVNWSQVVLVRNTSGYPRNINDGVQLFSEPSYSAVATVTAVHTTSSVSTITYSTKSTNKTSSGLAFEYYKDVPSTTAGAGSGASFDVTRSGALLGAVSSVSVKSGGGGYSVGDTLTISKNYIGYLDANGNASQYGTATEDITVRVTAVGSGTYGIKTFTVTQPSLQSPATGTFSYSNIASVATDVSTGTASTFDVSRVGNGTTATTSLTLRSSGANYKVGDVIRIPGSLIGGRTDSTSLGRTAPYHLYDTGTAGSTGVPGSGAGVTTNPGYGVTGTDLKVSKYYYSVFLKYLVKGETYPRWVRLANISSFAVKDVGTLDTILNHLPLFYRKNYQNVENKDLRDFLRLFAFHIDIYNAYTKGVFSSSTAYSIDENLLKYALKQFGFDITNVASVAQAKQLLNSLVKVYQTSGSLAGLKNLAVALTGWDAQVVSSRNLLNDYDSASFINSTGFWYPDPASIGHTASAPYTSGISWTTPVVAASTTQVSISSYNDSNGITLSNASSSGLTVTVTDTTGLTSGAALTVTTTAGTGVLATGTVVTSVLSSTQFKVNITPTTTLSGATLKTASNLNSGMAKIAASATTSAAVFNLGLKNTITATNYASGTNAIVVKPNIAAVGDYVISSGTIATTGATVSYVPYKTKVTAVDASTSTVTLSNNIQSAMATGTTVLFSPAPASDAVAALSSLPVVESGKPYAFSIKANAALSTTTNLKAVTAKMTWYDKTGTAISSTTGTLATASQTASGWSTAQISGVAPSNAVYCQPSFSAYDTYFIDAAQFDGPITTNTVTATNGTVTLVTDLSAPGFTNSNSVSVSGYGTPFDGTFTLTGASGNALSYSAGQYSITGVTAGSPATGKVTYTSANGFAVGQTVVIAGISSPAGYNGTFTIETVTSTNFSVANTTTGAVTLGTSPTATLYISSTSPTASAAGYVASASTFQDARKTQLNLLANRRNIIANPSFEVDTTGWTDNLSGGFTRSASAALFGGYGAYMVNLSGTSYIQTTFTHDVNKFYRASLWVKNTDATNPTSGYVRITWSDSTVTTGPTQVFAANSGWQRLDSGAMLSPASSAGTATVRFVTGTAAPAVTVYVDGALVEQSSTLSAYFDGSYDGQNYAVNGAIDSLWEGTAHSSISHLYYDRVFSAGKLDSMIVDGAYYA